MIPALAFRIRLFCQAAALFAVMATAAAADNEIGTVLSVRGAPVATDASGQFRKAALLQRVREGETVVFKIGDRLVVCNERLGAVFEIDGPGAVSIGQGGVTPLAAAPHVVRTGSCDESATVDSNGGVILRGMAPRKKAHPVPAPE